MRVSGTRLLHTLLGVHKLWCSECTSYALLASFVPVLLPSCAFASINSWHINPNVLRVRSTYGVRGYEINEFAQPELMSYPTWLSVPSSSSLLFSFFLQVPAMDRFFLDHGRSVLTRRLQASHSMMCPLIEWHTYDQLLAGENPEPGCRAIGVCLTSWASLTPEIIWLYWVLQSSSFLCWTKTRSTKTYMCNLISFLISSLILFGRRLTVTSVVEIPSDYYYYFKPETTTFGPAVRSYFLPYMNQ